MKRKTKNRMKRVLAVILCGTLVWLSATPLGQIRTRAAELADLQDKQQQLQEEQKENEQKLDELRDNEEEQQAYLETLQSQVKTMQDQIDTLNAQVDLLNDEITEKEEAIADKQAQIDDDMEQLKTRLKALYMAGDASTLAILLHADNIEDLARKSEVIKSITRHDTELIQSLNQELNDIPNGRYKLTAYILTNKKADEGGPQGLYVYATSFDTETRSSEQPLASPDGAGYASPVSVEFDVVNHVATVGFKAVDYNSNWAGVDNFKLEFMGAATVEATARDLLAKAIEDANANLNTVGRTSNAGKARFQEVINLATQAQQNTEVADDSLLALSDQLISEFDTLKADADAYAELQTITKGMEEKMSDPDSPYNGMLNGTEYYSYYSQLMVGYYAGTFDPKEIGGVQAKADSLYTEAIAALLTSGKTNNVTGMLVNPTFENNSASGWFETSVSGWSGTVATGVKDGTVEMYDKNYDFYQEFTGMPAGTYEMTLQGFHRPSNNDNCQTAWGVEGDPYYEVEAYAYVNDGLAELNHCYDHVTDTVVNGNDIALVVGDESISGKYAVNNITSASMVLAHGDYPVTVKGYVGSDGVLRVGVKLENKQANSWSAFGHFEIKYLGAADMSGANSTLNELIGLAQTLAAGDALATADTRKALNDAITAANNAVSGTLTEETYQSNTEALNKAMANFNDAIAAAAALETKAVYHDTKIWSSGEVGYDDYAGTEGYDELADLMGEILVEYVDEMADFETVDQIEQYSADIDRAYSKMVTADFDGTGASLEDAADATVFIINPSFSVKTVDEEGKATETSSADGWTTTGGAATSAMNYEIFNDSCEVYQMLYNMPAGYYRLIWNGFYRAGDYQPAAEDRVENDFTEPQNAEVFVDNGERHWSQKLASIFDEMTERKFDGDDRVLSADLFTDKEVQLYYVIPNNVAGAQGRFDDGMYEGNFSFHVAEGETPTIGVRKTGLITNDWTIFDNFRLEYYGENQPDDCVSSVEEAVAEWKDKFLRLQAEFDNYRKRTLKEKMDLVQTGGRDVLLAMLPVRDDVQRAVAAMEKSDDVEALRQGVQLISQKFTEALRQKGVVEMDLKEKEFDADIAEAVAKFAAGGEMKGKVIDVVQTGYMLGDKVLRFAKVVVGE